jgi:hypothetical protein
MGRSREDDDEYEDDYVEYDDETLMSVALLLRSTVRPRILFIFYLLLLFGISERT